MLTVEKVLVEQASESMQTNGRALDRRLDPNGLGGGHVCGRFSLPAGCRQRSWFFGHADVH